MTPKEKAEQLTWKYYHNIEHTISDEYSNKDFEISKQCVIIAVDEILEIIRYHGTDIGKHSLMFWEEVKEELEKL